MTDEEVERVAQEVAKFLKEEKQKLVADICYFLVHNLGNADAASAVAFTFDGDK
jgi:hypothetical protein